MLKQKASLSIYNENKNEFVLRKPSFESVLQMKAILPPLNARSLYSQSQIYLLTLTVVLEAQFQLRQSNLY